MLADRGGNAWAHWKHTLTQLLARGPDRILICQDDIITCRGLRQHLETRPWPAGAAWLSAYTARKYRHPDARGWHRKDGRGGNLCGALCMIFAPQAARELLADPMIAAPRWTGPALGKRGTPAYLDTCCIDGKCGAWARQNQRKVYYHTPSLVEHIGINNSSMNSPGNRRAAQSIDFVGEDWVPPDREPPA